MMEAKAFRTFMRVYSLLKSERLSACIKLIVQKALIRSIMAYACPVCDFAIGGHLLKWQRLRKNVLRTTLNFPRRTPVGDLYMAFNLPYIYDYT
jgi:hypothetical protein